jgi:hypothetical protein
MSAPMTQRLIAPHAQVDGVQLQVDRQQKGARATVGIRSGDAVKIADALNGRAVGSKRIVASTDRQFVINDEEQYG